jgi:hypothetical protein
MAEFRTPSSFFDYSAYFQAGFSLLSATNDMMESVFVSADGRNAFDRVDNAIQREAFIKYALVDLFGTPFPEKLRVVAYCRLIDFEGVRKARRATQRRTCVRRGPARSTVTHLQVGFTVTDEGVFTTLWTRTSPMGWGSDDWPEIVCAEISRRIANPTPTFRWAAKPGFGQINIRDYLMSCDLQSRFSPSLLQIQYEICAQIVIL